MPHFKIEIVNEEFVASEDCECDGQVSARERAVASALEIATEQVKAGKPFFGAVVTISEGDKELIRLVISAGASPLKTLD